MTDMLNLNLALADWVAHRDHPSSAGVAVCPSPTPSPLCPPASAAGNDADLGGLPSDRPGRTDPSPEPVVRPSDGTSTTAGGVS